MSASRYANDPRINYGTQYGSARAVLRIRNAIKNGTIVPSSQIITTQGDRLDTIAGEIYGDARLWWVLAAASDIGWGMQIPPGTVIKAIRVEDLEKAL